MIKINYKEDSYCYNEMGKQDYDVSMEINIKEDASVKDVVDAIIRILQGARYRVTKTVMLNTIEDIFEGREDY